MARKRRPVEHANHERWLVSYADFMTLLFAFFTTLYAISTVDQKKAGKLMYSMMTALNVDLFPGQGHAGRGIMAHDAPIEAPVVPVVVPSPSDGKGAGDGHGKLDALAAELGTLVNDPGLAGRVQVRLEKRGVVVSLAEAGFFDSGAGELKRSASAALGIVANKLKSQPDLQIIVEGHTDNRPVRSLRYRSNWELSTARATYVVTQFQEQYAFPASALSVAGYAEHRPVSTNDTTEGRAHNRRVDLVVRFKADTDGAPAADQDATILEGAPHE